MQSNTAKVQAAQARYITMKEAASGIRTWILETACAATIIAAIALATALTAH